MTKAQTLKVPLERRNTLVEQKKDPLQRKSGLIKHAFTVLMPLDSDEIVAKVPSDEIEKVSIFQK